MGLVSSCVSWASYFCGLVPLWINFFFLMVQSSYFLMSRNFFSRETNVFLEGRYFFRGSEICCCGPNIFFFSWFEIFPHGSSMFFVGQIFILVCRNFFSWMKISSVFFSCVIFSKGQNFVLVE